MFATTSAAAAAIASLAFYSYKPYSVDYFLNRCLFLVGFMRCVFPIYTVQ